MSDFLEETERRWAEEAKNDPVPGTRGVDEDGLEFVWSEPISIGWGFRPKPMRTYSGEAFKRRIQLDAPKLLSWPRR